MKALLLKDFYMLAKYCRSYLIIAAAFTAVSIFTPESFFFSAYIYLIVGMLPVTLMAYDERSKWVEYSAALPYGKSDIVLSKYIMGILVQLAMVLLTELIKIAVKGFGGILSDITVDACGVSVTLVMVSIILPLMFWFGVEKGRVAYYIIAGVSFSIIFGVTNNMGEGEEPLNFAENFSPAVVGVMFLAAVILYAVSALISIGVYKRREIK